MLRFDGGGETPGTRLPYIIDQFLRDVQTEIDGDDSGAFPDGFDAGQTQCVLRELIERASYLLGELDATSAEGDPTGLPSRNSGEG